MLFDKQYDLIFGIGGACSCTQILRKCRLQFYTYPFDWLFGADIVTRANIVADDFAHFIDREDLDDTGRNNGDANNLCQVYHNHRNDITFNHDFTCGKPLAETYGGVKEKYDRRIRRLMRQIESSENVLAVYLQIPNDPEEVPDAVLREAHAVLKARFPRQNVDLLYLFCQHGNKNFSYRQLQEGLMRVEYDYDAYDANVPYAVDNEILQPHLCKLKLTNKFVTRKNKCRRYFYLARCFFKGML